METDIYSPQVSGEDGVHQKKERASTQNGFNSQEFLHDLCERNRKFYADPRGMGALKDLQQTFPHPWLYIAELIQNAVDEGAKRIHIAIENEQTLVFEHDGRPFSRENVEALCTRGVSSKGAGTVGFMGVGFKAVFRSFEQVQVSSSPWRFRLVVAAIKGNEFGDLQRNWLGAVLPIWDNEAMPPSEGMTCRFVLSRRLSDLPPIPDDLNHIFGKESSLLALLAWREIEELNWNGEQWLLAKSKTSLDHEQGQRVILESLDASGQNLHRWILFSATYAPSRAAIARFLEHRQITPKPEEKEKVYVEAQRSRQVAIFCELGEDDAPIPVSRGSAFALLPTDVTFPLGLHVQADWLLVISRRELMQIEGNAWHEEILKQIPRLLRYYLLWLTSGDMRGDGTWPQGYAALPDQPRPDVSSDSWFANPNFRDSLKNELERLPFLPVPSSGEGLSTFLAPYEARILPGPLVRVFDDGLIQQRLLFGDRIVSTCLLGERGTGCLKGLGLLYELTPQELEVEWKAGRVQEWMESYSLDERNKALGRLLAALADLDAQAEWKDAKLDCLPTEPERWLHRGAALRLPSDWNIFAQEPQFQSALQAFVGSQERILSHALENVLSNQREEWQIKTLRYLKPIHSSKLEEIVQQWWDSLPEQLSAEQVKLVLQFTSWVQAKQPQRKNLVRKLLCVSESNGRQLLPTGETLLAQPYAGEFRRVFFPTLQVVARDYLDQDPEVGETEWRSFFESLNPPPKGPFSLVLQPSEVMRSDLQRQGYNPPQTRATSLRPIPWRGISFDYKKYQLLDAQLPQALQESLKNEIFLLETTHCMAEWMLEKGTSRLLKELQDYYSRKLAYVPAYQASVQEDCLNVPASWVNDLSNCPWIFTKDGTGPLRPCDVLPSIDPARPHAPIAALPPEFVSVLQQVGIQLGRAIPNAPAIDRLRVQGPSANGETLMELVRKAIEETDEDEEKHGFLQQTFEKYNLFPLPSKIKPVDGVQRIPYSRLVRTTSRSDLGSWVIAIAAFEEGLPGRQVLDLVNTFSPVPVTTTAAQAMDFLSWVWETEPEADRVRGVLPRAYQYLREDLNNDEKALAKWRALQPKAKIFVQSQRRWTSVAGNEKVFLDDIGHAAISIITSEIELATPGHLGPNRNEQVATAQLLGLSLLSSCYRVAVCPVGELPVPDHWQHGFQVVQSRLRNRLGSSDEEAVEDDAMTTTKNYVPLNLSAPFHN